MFFCILFVFFSYFFVYFYQKIRDKYKKYKKIGISQIQNIQKKYESTISKIQNTKKIQTQNFKNTKYKEKTNSKINQRANPVFTVEIRRQIAKKIQNQPLVFSKPCSSDFVFLGCIFFVFFLYFEMLAEDPSVATADNSNLSIYLSSYLSARSKTKRFSETSLMSEHNNFQNETILRDVFIFRSWRHQKRKNSARLPSKMESWVQSWQPRTNAFCDFSSPPI